MSSDITTATPDDDGVLPRDCLEEADELAQDTADAFTRPRIWICTHREYKLRCFSALGGPKVTSHLRLLHSFDTNAHVSGSVRHAPLRVVKVSSDMYAVSEHDSPYHLTVYRETRPEEGKSRVDEPLVVMNGNVSYTYGLGAVPPTGPMQFPRLVSGDGRSTAIVWHVGTGELLTKLPGPPEMTYSVRCVPEWNGDEVYVAGSGSRLGPNHYNMVKSTKIQELKGHKGQISGLAPNVESGALYTSSDDKTAKIYAPSQSSEPVGKCFMEHMGCSAYYAADIHVLLLGSRSGWVEQFDPRKTSAPLRVFRIHDDQLFGGIVRVARRIFVSSGCELAKWTIEGKRIISVQPAQTQHYGITTFGLPYDFPATDDIDESALLQEVEERISYLIGGDSPLGSMNIPVNVRHRGGDLVGFASMLAL